MANTQQQHDIVLNGKDNATSTFAKVAASMKNIEQAANKVQGALTFIKAGIAAIAVEELASKIKDTLDAADAMNDLSQRTGVAASTLSSFQLAAKLGDTSVENIGSSLFKLSKNMHDAANGNKDMAQSFANLGVSFKDNEGKLRSNEAVMLDVAEKFSQMEDGAYKTAVAMEIFGKSGADMIPFLNQGKEGIQQMQKEAVDFGIALSESTLKKIGDFNDAMDKLGLVSKNGMASMVSGALPGITALLNVYMETSASIKHLISSTEELAADNSIPDWAAFTAIYVGTVGDAIQGLKNIIMTLYSVTKEQATAVGKILGTLAAAVRDAFKGNFKMSDFMGELNKIVTDGGKSVVDSFNKQINETRFSTIVRGALDKVASKHEETTKRIKVDAESQVNALKEIREKKKKIIDDEIKDLEGQLKESENAVKNSIASRNRIYNDFAKMRANLGVVNKPREELGIDDLKRLENQAASLRHSGNTDGAVEAAKQAADVVKAMLDSGKLTLQDADTKIANLQTLATGAANDKVNEALSKQAEQEATLNNMLATKKKLEEPIVVNFEAAKALAQAEQLKNDLQAKFNANPLTIPTQVTSPGTGTTAGQGVVAGVANQANQPTSTVNLTVGNGTYQMQASSDTASQLATDMARENLKAGR